MYSIFMPASRHVDLIVAGPVCVISEKNQSEKSYDDSKKFYVPDHRTVPHGINTPPAGCFR